MSDPISLILGGLCGDPRGALGILDPPRSGDAADSTKASRNETCSVRVFLPPARAVSIQTSSGDGWVSLARVHAEGVFEGEVPADARDGYRLQVEWESGDRGETTEIDDPFRFAPSVDESILAAFLDGGESRLQDLLGAHECERDGVSGTRFAVWAPRAEAVNLMGSFNGWEGRRAPMFPVPGTGVWELFLPGVGAGTLYKYQVRARVDGEGVALDKADPMGRKMEVRPRTASVVASSRPFVWRDQVWLDERRSRGGAGTAISIYEAHLGSWRRHEDGSWLGYRALTEQLLPYVKDLGFTHIELLPMTEHPYDASWGYQTIGYYALTSRYGEPDDFKAFVDEAHRLGIRVLLDWVPGHFPLDAHGLRAFDGAPLYELDDAKRATHPDWGTLEFDYGRPEVVSFLVSSARFWLEEYHLDGLRVDAVASMLRLDYSREAGEWEPNELGGPENLEAVAFVRALTDTIHEHCPGALLFAEESMAWPGVTAPIEDDGLGFDFKWNMGWMNDTLRVFETDPHRRPERHERLTFSITYAHDERHLLPLSHDEVVHLKRSLLSKMPGGYDGKFAGLRLLLGYMWTHPGAKLLFMGGELGMWAEWSEDAQLDWDVLGHPSHLGIQRWVRALNETYRREPALHVLDDTPEGFEWIDVHDASRSVLSYLRWQHDWEDFVAVVANFSAIPWPRYKLAVPTAGTYEVILDSDDRQFGGTGQARLVGPAVEAPLLGRPATLTLDLPPLSIILLRRVRNGG